MSLLIKGMFNLINATPKYDLDKWHNLSTFTTLRSTSGSVSSASNFRQVAGQIRNPSWSLGPHGMSHSVALLGLQVFLKDISGAVCNKNNNSKNLYNPSQWPRGRRRGFAVVCMMGLWVRIPPGEWISVFCECCMLSSICLCVGLITCTEGVLSSVLVKPQ